MNKKVFIILISILLILIFIVSLMLYKISKEDLNKNENNIFQNSIVSNTQINAQETKEDEIVKESAKENYAKELNNMDELLSVKQCIDAFLFNASMESYNGVNLYDILDEEYMAKYNLDKNSLGSVASEYYGDFSFIIKSCYTHQIASKLNIYFVYGDFINRETGERQEKSFILKIDKINSAYSIFLENYIIENGYNKEVILEKNLEEFSNSKVEKQRFNEYKSKEYSKQDYCSYYFGIYSTYLQYFPEGLYDILDKEYREKRFGNLDNMKNYIEKNKDKLFNEMMFKYNVNENDNYIEYSFIDGNGRVRNVKALSPTNISIELDTYTLDKEEFLKKYNRKSDIEKVEVNINRFFEAVKSYDYDYAYNKLDENFKSQYFSTLEEFEDYAKTTFIYGQKISYNDFSEEDGNYKYTVEFEVGDNIIEKIITIELLEETDYRISFDIN